MYSLVLNPGQTHTVEISTPLNLTNIAFGEEVVGQERSVVKIRYFYADEEDDEVQVVGDDGKPKEAVIAALIPSQVEQFSTSIVLTSDVDYVELSCTGDNAVHIIGHYLPSSAASVVDGPLDGPDSDASSDSDWDLEDELDGPELELPPSLLAIKAQNDAFDIEQAYLLLAKEGTATEAATQAANAAEHAYDDYVYQPPAPTTSAPAFLDLTLPDGSSDDDSDSAYDEDAEMDEGTDDEMEEESEDEHESDILDLQRQAAGELKGIQQVMLQRRLAEARRLVAAHEAQVRGE